MVLKKLLDLPEFYDCCLDFNWLLMAAQNGISVFYENEKHHSSFSTVNNSHLQI